MSFTRFRESKKTTTNQIYKFNVNFKIWFLIEIKLHLTNLNGYKRK